jgi:hypothetical protein
MAAKSKAGSHPCVNRLVYAHVRGACATQLRRRKKISELNGKRWKRIYVDLGSFIDHSLGAQIYFKSFLPEDLLRSEHKINFRFPEPESSSILNDENLLSCATLMIPASMPEDYFATLLRGTALVNILEPNPA